MPKANLVRTSPTGTQAEFKAIGTKITLTEKQRDKWASIPPAPVMTSDESETLTMLEQRLGLAKERHLKRMDVFNNSYLQYRSVNYYSQLYGGYPSYWNAWGVNAFIPRTFETIETMRAQLKSKMPDFALEPQHKKLVNYAQGATDLMRGEWKRSDSQGEAIEALDDALLWGSGILRNDLINEVADENKLTFDENGNLKYTIETVNKYYGVASRRIDPYDFFPEPLPDATKINGKRNRNRGINWCFLREIVDVEDLREQFKQLHKAKTYGITDKFQYLTPGGDLQDYKYLRTYLDDLYQAKSDIRYPATITSMLPGATSKSSTEFAYTEGKIEVHHYFERDRWITVAQGLILRDTPNPYPHKQLPFSKMSLFNTKTFWDMGMPEVMRWLQVVENTLYDQGLNNIVMNVHKMFAVNSRYLEDEGELVVRPFGIVHLKNIPGVSVNDAIMPIQFSPLFNDFFNFLNLNKGNIDSLTGISDYTKGTSDKKEDPDTLGQSKMAAQGNATRINEIARHFEQDLLADAIEQQFGIIQLYYQTDLGGEDGMDIQVQNGANTDYYRYLPKKRAEMTDSEMQTYSPANGYKGTVTHDEIQGQFKATVKGGSTIASDPEDDAKLKLQFANWAKTLIDPATIKGYDAKGNPIGSPVFDISKLAMEVAKEVFKMPNPEDFKFTPQQQAAASGQAAPAAGMNPDQPNNGAAPAPAAPAAPATPVPQAINQEQG